MNSLASKNASGKFLRVDRSSNQHSSPGRRSFLSTCAAALGLAPRPARAATTEPIALSALFENFGMMTEIQVVGPGQDFPPPSRPLDPQGREPLHPGLPLSNGYRFRLVSVAITAAEAEAEYARIVRHCTEKLGIEPYPDLRKDVFAHVA